MRQLLLAVYLFAIPCHNILWGQSDPFGAPEPEEEWVDSVFQSLSTDERLGQLFMIRAHSDLGANHINEVQKQITKYGVGGLCFFQGTPEKQIELINTYQGLSPNIPLMIAIDGEWGLGMRMKASTISFPYQLMLGAIQDNDLIYEMGAEVARQFKRTGIHVNFAPVVDINNNPDNPVINYRSFGEDRFNVAVKSYMYMKGMQDNGVLGCAKHFPGHGDTNVDSHLDLPIINHDINRLDSLELYPFRVLAKQGVGSMMIAHLHVPALDDRENRPTTLSRSTITGLLREKMSYDGLLFTDALEMKGVTKHFAPGEVEAEALLAGNDILLLPEDIGLAIREIKDYISEGRLSQIQVDASVKRVLRAKYKLGLNQFKALDVSEVRSEINSPEAEVLLRRLVRASLTLVRNQDKLIPFQKLDDLDIASLSIGANSISTFQERLNSYKKMVSLQSPLDIPESEQEELLRILGRRDVVVVGIHDMSQFSRFNFGLTSSTLAFLHKLNERTKVVLCLFGNPYSLSFFDSFEHVLVGYSENEVIEDLAAQGLFGVFGFRGRLPVTASPDSRYNQGVYTQSLYRMGYTIPEEVKLSRDSLALIDDLMQEAIQERATPGGVILVARDRQIVWHKAYGHHTYTQRTPTRVDDLFDVASITKVAATTISVMKMEEEGLVDVAKPMSWYLPALRVTNKSDLELGDVMAHQSGLKPWIPFYRETLTPKGRYPTPALAYYRKEKQDEFSVPVSPDLYMRNDYRDTIWQTIFESDLLKKKKYRYSDLGFILMTKMIAHRTGLDLDVFANQHFYGPMGLEHITFNPWQDMKLDRVVPTEEDQYFRYNRLQGYVHDMAAAMLGGVSGHAGLFSNAKDLAAIFQMLLNGGKYGGSKLLERETIDLFTTRYKNSTRRGLGFDMLQLDRRSSANLSEKASEKTFGHLGFTGTCIWADPEAQLIYVFLSNRTFPTMGNYELNKLDTRIRIQDQVYRSLLDKPSATDKKSNPYPKAAGPAAGE